MELQRETRLFQTELRATQAQPDDETSTPIVEGYSALFNSYSVDMGYGEWKVYEKIAPGAFTEALGRSDVRGLINHRSELILGRQSAKTLILTVDETGLHARYSLPETSYAKDLMISVERGDVREQSFAFTVASDGQVWEDDYEKKVSIRTITKFKEIFDVSIVTYPAYNDTTVLKRCFDSSRVNVSEDRNADIEARLQTLKLKARLYK